MGELLRSFNPKLNENYAGSSVVATYGAPYSVSEKVELRKVFIAIQTSGANRLRIYEFEGNKTLIYSGTNNGVQVPNAPYMEHTLSTPIILEPNKKYMFAVFVEAYHGIWRTTNGTPSPETSRIRFMEDPLHNTYHFINSGSPQDKYPTAVNNSGGTIPMGIESYVLMPPTIDGKNDLGYIGTAPQYKVKVSDEVAVTKLEAKYNGVVFRTINGPTMNTEINIDLTSIWSTIPNGEASFTVEATDNEGAISTKKVSFYKSPVLTLPVKLSESQWDVVPYKKYNDIDIELTDSLGNVFNYNYKFLKELESSASIAEMLKAVKDSNIEIDALKQRAKNALASKEVLINEPLNLENIVRGIESFKMGVKKAELKAIPNTEGKIIIDLVALGFIPKTLIMTRGLGSVWAYSVDNNAGSLYTLGASSAYSVDVTATTFTIHFSNNGIEHKIMAFDA